MCYHFGHEEGEVLDFFDVVLIAQYLLTALSSGFNASYFWSYRSPRRGRRIGALVLFGLSLSLVIESIYFGLFAVSLSSGLECTFFTEARHWLAARGLVCLGSLAISVLVLRKLWSR